jgi:pentapeptide repeat protein
MRTVKHIDDAIARVISAETSDFVTIVDIAGLDPLTDFRFTNLAGVDFTNCDLTGFDFTGASISGAIFNSARISGAIFKDVIGDTTGLRRALDWAEFRRRAPSSGHPISNERKNIKRAKKRANLRPSRRRDVADRERRRENNQELEVHTEADAKAGSQFDYRSMPLSVAKFLMGQAKRLQRQTTYSIIQIGRDLIAAKHYMPNRQFVDWINAEVGIPARTAKAYMRVAMWASGKDVKAMGLPPSLLYVLSAPSTPQEFISGILDDVEAGRHVELATTRAKLRALRHNRRTMIQGTNAVDQVQEPDTEVEGDARVHGVSKTSLKRTATEHQKRA